MDLETLIKTRRSIRSFTDQKVDIGLIKKIIELGTYAPSACNFQAWSFIVVESQKIKNEIVNLGGPITIKNAPLGILVLYDKRTKNIEYQDYIQGAAASIENILLAAHSYGLGACWICHLPPKKQLKKLFKIKNNFEPIAYIVMGYPKKKPFGVTRKHKIEDLISINKFDQKSAIKIEVDNLILLKRILLKIYHYAPLWLKKLFLNKLVDKNFVKKFKN